MINKWQLLSYEFYFGGSGMSEYGGRAKLARVWNSFAYVFILKAINRGKVLILDLYLHSIKIQNLMQANMKEIIGPLGPDM
jgi:hypothetical protein